MCKLIGTHLGSFRYVYVCIQSTAGIYTRQLISCTSIIISVYFNLQLMLIALRKSEYCHSSFVVAISNHADEICHVLQETANVTRVKVKRSRRVSDKISLHFFSMSHFLSLSPGNQEVASWCTATHIDIRQAAL